MRNGACLGVLLLASVGCRSYRIEIDPRVNYNGLVAQELLVTHVQADHTDDGRLRARFEIHNVSSKSQLFHLVVFFKDDQGNIINGDAEKQIHLLAPGGIEPVDDHWYGFDARDFQIVVSPARTE